MNFLTNGPKTDGIEGINLLNVILGSWTPLFFNDIFICPCLYSNGYIDKLYENKNLKPIIDYIDKNEKNIFINDKRNLMSTVGPTNDLLDYFNFKDGDNYYNYYYSFILEYIKYKRSEIIYNFEKFLNINKDNNKYEEIPESLSSYIIKRPNSLITFVIHHNSWIKNLNKFKKLKYFLIFDGNYDDITSFENINSKINNDDNDIILLIITICHELYHKWQFSANWFTPIFYIANFFNSLFISYENASKNKWLIEGDVRKYVDNNQNNKIFLKLLRVISYIEYLGNVFTYETFLKDEKFSNYRNELNKSLLGSKIFFNQNFENKIEIKKENTWTEDMLELYERSKDIESLNCKIKGTNEYNFIMKILKDNDILTDEFLKFLEKV